MHACDPRQCRHHGNWDADVHLYLHCSKRESFRHVHRQRQRSLCQRSGGCPGHRGASDCTAYKHGVQSGSGYSTSNPRFRKYHFHPERPGWYNRPVVIPYSTSDNLSGVASATATSPATNNGIDGNGSGSMMLTTEGKLVTGSVTVTDYARNTAAPFVSPNSTSTRRYQQSLERPIGQPTRSVGITHRLS